MKPNSESCSEKGISCFEDEQKLKDYLLKHPSEPPMLIQEYIDGKEYIIDSFSYNGKHTIIGASSYELDNPGIPHCQHITTIGVDSVFPDLAQYALSVLDALDIKHGFTHMEVKVNQAGCYLIEVNPRLPGVAGFICYLCEASFGKSHMDVWKTVVRDKADTPTIPTFSKVESTVFFLMNYGFDYQSIHKDIIESLPSYAQMKIIKETAEKPTFQSRLNTIAFIALQNKDTQALKEDIVDLMKLQDAESSSKRPLLLCPQGSAI